MGCNGGPRGRTTNATRRPEVATGLNMRSGRRSSGQSVTLFGVRAANREPRDASAGSTWTGPDLIRPSKAGPLKLRCALASRPDWRDWPGVAKALVRVPSGRALQADDRRSKDET